MKIRNYSMQWLADSTEPNIKTGTAIFYITNGNQPTIEIGRYKLQSFSDANTLFAMINLLCDDSYAILRRKMIQHLENFDA